MSSKALKIIIGCVCAALMAWLVFSPSTNRVDAINNAIKTHRLNHLVDSDLKALSLIVGMICKASGINERVRLDEPILQYRPLSFLVTDSKLEKLTHCSKSNAIYDKELNAVFIDESLVVPTEWNHYMPAGRFPILVTAKEMPFLQTFLEFVIAHEIGHFKLHRHLRNNFDASMSKNSGEFQRQELQADSFAVQTMIKAIMADKDGNFLPKNIGGTMELNADTMNSATDKAVLAITDVGRNMPVALLMGPETYSPYETDAAHPAFFERSRNAVFAVRNLPCKITKVHAEAIYTLQSLNAIDRIAHQYSFTEIYVPEQILNVNFDKKGIVIQPLDSVGKLYKLPYDGFKNVTMQGSVKKVRAVPVLFKRSGIPYDFEHGGVWSFSEGNVFALDRASHLYQAKGNNAWILKKPELYQSFIPEMTPPQISPATNFIYFNGEDPYCLKSDMAVIKGRKEDVARYIGKFLKSQNVDILWDKLLVVKNEAFVIVGIHGYQKVGMTGVVRLSLPLFKPKQFIQFNLNDLKLNAIKDSFDFNKSCLLVSQNRYFLVTSENFTDGFGLFELSERLPPVLIKEQYFLFHGVPHAGLLEIQPKLADGGIINYNGNKYLINWGDDLFYSVDLDTKVINPIYYPGFWSMQMRVSQSGDIAFYNIWLNKIYVITTKQNHPFLLYVIGTIIVLMAALFFYIRFSFARGRAIFKQQFKTRC